MSLREAQLRAEAEHNNANENIDNTLVEDRTMVEMVNGDVTLTEEDSINNSGNKEVGSVGKNELIDRVAEDLNTGNETKLDKHEKFLELGKKRVNGVLYSLKRVGYLANTKNYTYSDEEVAKMINSIEKSVDKLKKKFNGEAEDEEFSFD